VAGSTTILRGMALLVALALAACTPLKPIEPVPTAWRLGAERRPRPKTVCLHPTQIPAGIPEPQRKIDSLEFIFNQRLTEVGFTVVPSAKVEESWQAITKREGGVFDPDTGRRDEDRYQRIADRARAEMKTTLGCDVFLAPTVSMVLAPWTEGIAEWDGRRDSLQGGRNAFGRVPAFSLWVAILDLDGEEIYFGTGGIEVAAELQSEFLSERFEGVDESDMLTDGPALYGAVAASLGDFLWPPTVDGAKP